MPEDPSRAVFVPAWWAGLVLIGSAIAAFASLAAFPAVEWTDHPVWVVIVGGVALGLTWLVTQGLWSFSDQSHTIFQLVFLGIWGSLLVTGLIVAREIQLDHDRAMVEEINEARLAMRRRAIEQAKETLADAENRRRRVEEDRFARYEGRVEAETLDRMRAADAEILASLEEAADRYRKVLAENPTQGPESWLRFATLEEVEEERARTRRVYEAARAYNDFLEGLSARYEAKLAELDLAPPADRYAIAEMERVVQGWERSGAREIRQLDVAISTIAIQALDLLIDRWGEWRFDRANSRVVFDDGGLELAFVRRLREAGQLVSEQDRLRRRLERMREDRNPAE